jgi:hypothetical protein
VIIFPKSECSSAVAASILLATRPRHQMHGVVCAFADQAGGGFLPQKNDAVTIVVAAQ